MRVLLLVVWLGFASNALAQSDAPVIAAASDLKFALEELTGQYTAQTGRKVKLAFGSSGNFRRQIAEGAPFELFMSADEGYVLALAEEGYTLDKGALYAIGRIVLMVPAGSPVRADGAMKDLRAAIDDGRLKKLAIANPEHAPYGRAAREALMKAGLWEKVQPRLVLGENIAQATQFVTSGGAEAGIIAYSLALSPSVSKLGSFALLPAEDHQPLRQRMVLTKRASESAKNFYRYVQSPPARAVFEQYGFVLP